MMHRPQVITLDAYGTLLHLERPYERLSTQLQRLGQEVPPAAVESAFKREMLYYRDHHLQGRDQRSLEQLRLRCAGVLFEALEEEGYRFNIPASTKVSALMNAIRFRLFDDVPPLLEWCAEQGLSVGVISNWDVSLPQILQALCPGMKLGCLLVSAAEGLAKPAGELYRRAAAALGVAPESILHVGDDPQADFKAARAAGFQALLLERGAGVSPGRKTVRSLADVPACFAIQGASSTSWGAARPAAVKTGVHE